MSFVRYLPHTDHYHLQSVTGAGAAPPKAPDLSYRQLKAIILFQELFKVKRHTVHTLNKTIDTIYRTLLSVSQNINNNYLSNVITLDQHQKYMEQTDKLVAALKIIPRPVCLRHLASRADKDIKAHVLYLHYQLYDLVKTCGASSCYDVFNLLGGENWDISLSPKQKKVMDLYNTFFVPVTVRILPTPEEFKVTRYTSFTLSIMLKIHGAEISLPFAGTSIIIKGYFRDDPLNLARLSETLALKSSDLTEAAHIRFADGDFSLSVVNAYLQQIPLRDFIALDQACLLNSMCTDLIELKKLRTISKETILEDFMKSGIKRQYTILTLILIGLEEPQSIISALKSYETDTVSNVYRILHWSVQNIFDRLMRSVTRIDIDESNLPYETRIENMKASEQIKRKAREKLKEIKGSGTRDGNEKAVKYLDGLLRIPFGVYRKEPILMFLTDFLKKLNTTISSVSIPLENIKTEHEIALTLKTLSEYGFEQGQQDLPVHIAQLQEQWTSFKRDRRSYLSFVNETLDGCIYGQEEAKRSLESVIAHWINGELDGVVFGFQGFPGTGKTSLAKHGIAQCIRDADGNSRPFFFISLGGTKGGNTLLGHSYTYVGSQCGKLAECLQTAKIMNPILYFDELDKVSESSCGEEIIRILTHLTDPEQNDHIEDRYFGVDLDLSKALIIFSYNNSSKIDEILMDRIHEIKFKVYNKKDKIHIGLNYLLPKILKSLGYATASIVFSEDILSYIIESYTHEAGVRDLKDKLLEITREFNLRRIYNEDQYLLPFHVTETFVDETLKVKNKIMISSIAVKPQVGLVNGLYATALGTGGITVIQVFKTPSDNKYNLELTGKLGDVMRESIKCAKTISWNIIPEPDRIWGEGSLHIHFPAAGTSKDGPSAGAAITLAVVSYLCKLPVRNDVALTGEIDLHGNILPIGGLQCKIEGAQRAGVKLVLIPRENEKELREFEKDINIPVIAVDNISQIIRTCLLNPETVQFSYMHQIDDETVQHILSSLN